MNFCCLRVVAAVQVVEVQEEMIGKCGAWHPSHNTAVRASADPETKRRGASASDLGLSFARYFCLPAFTSQTELYFCMCYATAHTFHSS